MSISVRAVKADHSKHLWYDISDVNGLKNYPRNC